MSPIPAASTATLPGEMPLTHLAHAFGGAQSVVTRLVLHSAECALNMSAAEMIDGYFESATPGTSAHYAFDPDSTTHSVPEGRVAYHAPPNQGSIGFEHAGLARFVPGDWATPDALAMLERSQDKAVEVCKRWGIPAVFLTAADLKANPQARGITTHNEVSLAFGESTHHDPGPGFPVDAYVAAVAAKLNPTPAVPAPATPTGEDNPVQFVVIEAPGRSPAFFTTDGVGHPMGSGGWTFISRFAKKHPDLVIFDKTWSAAEYDLVVRKA